MQAAIEVDSLSVTLDSKRILHDISLSVKEGEIVGLLGPSGAGKTTLIRAILGLQKPANGHVSVLGLLAGNKNLHSRVGYVTQTPAVYADLTVMENLSYFAALLGANRRNIQAVLEDVELSDHKHRVVGNLSGGETARVSLATALLGKPELLLLDEPTVGLDPVLRQRLWSKFAKLSQNGVTILVSSHVMDEAEKCDSLLFIREGELLASDTRQAILRDTKAASMEAAFLNLAEGAKQ